jgi:DNA-binding MarR family transcriptional regulator
LLSLQEKPKFPSQIAKEIEHDLNSISNILTQLRKKGIIKLVNPEVRKGRIYRLTEVGEEIAQNL